MSHQVYKSIVYIITQYEYKLVSFQMLAAGSLAFAKAYSSVEKLEIELEAEIQRDKETDSAEGKTIQVSVQSE